MRALFVLIVSIITDYRGTCIADTTNERRNKSGVKIYVKRDAGEGTYETCFTDVQLHEI